MAVSTPEIPRAQDEQTTRHPGLTAQLSLRLGAIFAVLASILFASAGTFRYWQASLCLLVLTASGAAVSFVTLVRNPEVIARRLRTAQRSRSQQALVRAFRPLFFCLLFLPGLDHRLRLTTTITGPVPPALSIAADIVLLAAVIFCGWVFEVNHFADRCLGKQEKQQVIDSGPYGLVRHPLNAASLLGWLVAPLALGSWIALPLFALVIPFYVLRIINEELQLTRELKGYAAYCKRTPFRLIPFVW
ncbi:isoprenylcysteine carboxylmethyltransferase family protein [Acidobacteria bacterium AB60]|nr:isoprenylcysteine carboxylmethyltransferase family protein [Acidobacteria bacterium AB60]